MTVLARGGDFALYAQHEAEGSWSGYQGLGGFIASDPGATSDNSKPFVFVLGGDSAVYTKHQVGGVWSGWQGLGLGAISNPVGTPG